MEINHNIIIDNRDAASGSHDGGVKWYRGELHKALALTEIKIACNNACSKSHAIYAIYIYRD